MRPEAHQINLLQNATMGKNLVDLHGGMGKVLVGKPHLHRGSFRNVYMECTTVNPLHSSFKLASII